MKIILIALLVLAAGTGVWFFLANKNKINKPAPHPMLQLAGNWETIGKDSANNSGRFRFTAGSLLFHTTTDSLPADTFHYQIRDAQLLLMHGNGDSSANYLSILLATEDTLQLKTTDSSILLLHRINSIN